MKKNILVSPFSLSDKMEDSENTFRGSSLSLICIPVYDLQSWENPYWMDEQLDQYENQINLDTDGKDKC